MKRVLLITAISFTFFTAAMASIIPTEATLLINTADVEVSLVEMDQMDIFESADFNVQTNSFNFVTKEKINYVQIFKADGTLAFQLPVASNKVRIHKKIFDKGQNKLGFMIEGHGSVEFTGVRVK